jgi:hypothetical protein
MRSWRADSLCLRMARSRNYPMLQKSLMVLSNSDFLKSRWLSVGAALLAAAAISFFAPAAWHQRLWPGWVVVVPIGALAVLAYYLTPFFTR